MITKFLFSCFSKLYSAIGTEIKYTPLIKLKNKLETQFKSWINRYDESQESIISLLRVFFGIQFIICIILHNQFQSYHLDKLSLFSKNELIISLIITISLTTKAEFEKNSITFINKLNEYKFWFIPFTVVYIILLLTLTGFTNDRTDNHEIFRYVIEAFLILIIVLFTLYFVMLFLPFQISMVFVRLVGIILRRSNKYGDDKPIGHFLRLISYLFIIFPLINFLYCYIKNLLKMSF